MAVAPQPIPTVAEAVVLVDAGELDEALQAFQRIAAANPNDHEARLWIARVHVLMDHPERAEPVFRSVALEDPTSLTAILGVGDALSSRREFDEAIEVLEGAEKRAPEDPEVLAALGRAHARAGHSREAVTYFQRASGAAPTEANAVWLERARLAHGHRVDVAGLIEQFDGGLEDTHGADVNISVRLAENFRLTGRGQVAKKFGFNDERGGLGLEWRWKPATTILGHVLVGPGNKVLGQNEVYAELDHVGRNMQWMLGFRFVDFEGANISVVSPGLVWQATGRISLAALYSLSRTTSLSFSGSESSHSLRVDGSYLLRPRVSLVAGYATGVDRFDMLSIDRIGDFGAKTGSSGVRIDFPTLTSVLGVFEHSARDDGFNMNRFTVSLSQRF